MVIRKAIEVDASVIAGLLTQLDYKITPEQVLVKLGRMMDDTDEIIAVAENDEIVIAVISIHFIPQIAVQGDFARISYFSVDEHYRSNGIGKQLEEYCEKEARLRGCDRIEVHCHQRRTDAHRFYLRQGYTESPKYFMKLLRS
jgi:GNAT superfamily N-acetyltransferase